jgi:hypothetical protein
MKTPVPSRDIPIMRAASDRYRRRGAGDAGAVNRAQPGHVQVTGFQGPPGSAASCLGRRLVTVQGISFGRDAWPAGWCRALVRAVHGLVVPVIAAGVITPAALAAAPGPANASSPAWTVVSRRGFDDRGRAWWRAHNDAAPRSLNG